MGNLNKYYMSKNILLFLNSFLEGFDETDHSCRGIENGFLLPLFKFTVYIPLGNNMGI